MTDRVALVGFIGGAAAAATLLVSAPVLGQSDGAPVCLSGVSKAGPSRSFTFYVRQERVGPLEQRGFQSVSCSAATESFTEFRSAACQLSQSAPPAFKQAFERIYGISLDELCTLANEAG